MGRSEPNSRATGASPGLWWTRRRVTLAVLPLLLLTAAYIVATVDIRNHDGAVLRGVTLGGTDVGGMTTAELDEEFDRLSDLVESAPVYIETPNAAYQIDAERLGLKLDRNATRAAVLASGRTGSSIGRPFTWLQGLFSQRRVEPVLRLDAMAAEDGLRAVSKTISVQPGEPTMLLRDGRLVLEPGTAGSILDVEQLVRDLSTSLPSEPGESIEVDAVTTLENSIDVEIQTLVDQLNGATGSPIDLIVNGATIRVSSAEFRSWIRLDLTGEVPDTTMDTDLMYRWINAAAGIAEGEIDTRALEVDGSQIRLPASNAARCCRVGVGAEVLAAVRGGARTVSLELLADDITPLVELGISELVGEFATEHPAGEDRVINIQRMADIVRGAIIEPGETFSLNDYVGERTTAKGFVPAGVIYNGVFTEDIGGGVSQFATTLFNAAFFGGLDLENYTSHSIYIERYPYGREATVSWPSIDLKLRNPTDFPILIWTEYTPDSITVKLFGTATVRGEQTNQTEEALDECTRVRTERTRYWADGTEDVDRVGATYQPSEGVGCDGLPTLPPPQCDEGQALVDSDDNGFGDTCVPLEVVCPLDTEPIDDNGDRLIDYCRAEACPDGTSAFDTDGDGDFDECLAVEPTRGNQAGDTGAQDPDGGNGETETDDATPSDDDG